LKIAETADFQGFGIAREPLPYGRAISYLNSKPHIGLEYKK